MSNTSTGKVTFSHNVQIAETLSIVDYTTAEINAAWYNKDEMDKITQRCFKILQRVQSGVFSSKKTKYYMRGLESHTTVGSLAKQNNRSAAYTAVFEEQERQWKHKNKEIDQARAISDAYRRTTSSSQMWAQVVGNRDQQEVEAYLYDDEDMESCIETRIEKQSSTVSNIEKPKDSSSRIANNEVKVERRVVFRSTARAA